MILKVSSSSEILNEKSLCTIRNTKYSSEYLYSSLTFGDQFKMKVFTNEIDPAYMRSPLQPLWIIEPINYENRTLFLISNFYHSKDYLCATNDHLDRLGYRRFVRLDPGSTKTTDCFWAFEKLTNKKTTTFEIWNRKYNQALFAASFFFKTAKTNRRNVYLWAGKPDSKQFDWIINCNTEDFIKNLYI